MESAGWEPPGRWDVVHRGRCDGSGQFLIEPRDACGVFTGMEDVDAPLGRLGELVFAAVVRPHLMRVFARAMANVRRLAEEVVSS